MNFHPKKRRQPPAVIIVALIDILIVLLIFLLVTTSFTRMPAVRLSLPESTTAKKTGASESPPLIVSIEANGNVLVGADPKPLNDAQLKAELVAAVARNANIRLAVNADKAAPWGRVVAVWDVVKQTNIKEKTINAFVAEPKK